MNFFHSSLKLTKNHLSKEAHQSIIQLWCDLATVNNIGHFVWKVLQTKSCFCDPSQQRAFFVNSIDGWIVC